MCKKRLDEHGTVWAAHPTVHHPAAAPHQPEGQLNPSWNSGRRVSVAGLMHDRPQRLLQFISTRWRGGEELWEDEGGQQAASAVCVPSPLPPCALPLLLMESSSLRECLCLSYAGSARGGRGEEGRVCTERRGS